MSEEKPHVGIVICGHVDAGKTFDYNTEILMFNGKTKLAGEIRGGDVLMGDDSGRRIVQSTHEVYDAGYKISYNNGENYIINDKHAYASDVNHINKKDYSKIYKLKYLVIDCLREKPHPSHYNLDKILELIKEIRPNKTILTNLHSSIDYEKLKKKLPKSAIPAYDGMKLLIN